MMDSPYTPNPERPMNAAMLAWERLAHGGPAMFPEQVAIYRHLAHRLRGQRVVDVGCGMVAAQTNLIAADLPDTLTPLVAQFGRSIPAGVGQNRRLDSTGISDQRMTAMAVSWLTNHPHALPDKLAALAPAQLGTLGSGTSTQESWTNGFPAPQATRRAGSFSKYIAPLQQFSMTITFPGTPPTMATTANGGVGLYMIPFFDGLTDRSVQ